MDCRRPTRRHRLTLALLLSAIIVLQPAFAQRTHPPTLDDILLGLENNLHHYDTSIPSFFCDEHVVSQMFPAPASQNTVTNSVFRLKRDVNPDNTTSLDESREIKTVNGRPPTSQDINGPSVLSGVFEGGLALVSLNQKACMHYTLERIRTNRGQSPYIIRFATVDAVQRTDSCLLQEQGKGRVIIDPASLQITRMELTVPHHTIDPGYRTPGGYRFPPTIGQWVLSVDYAPVQLSGQTFWMPATITSHTSTGTNTFKPTFWSFVATYRKYHKLEVTSRIVPADGSTNP
jgi:hypothetical protein